MRVAELANPSRFLRAANLAIPWLGGATVLLFAFAVYRAMLAPDDEHAAPRRLRLSARRLHHLSDDPGAAVAHGGGVHVVVRDAIAGGNA